MATFTVNNDPRFHTGTTLYCYAQIGRIPVGGPVDSAVVGADGHATFDGLQASSRYVAGPASTGPFVEFQTDPLVLDEDLTDETVDTGELYRIIMFSNGDVRAIPADAEAPSTPTGLSAAVRLTSVRLTWAEAALAATYAIYRGGVQIGTSSVPDFRDTTVTVSSTYTYTVQAIDQYGQRSGMSASENAFIDPALNEAPEVTITCWPAEIPTNGIALVRVNAIDVDAQLLALTLDVDLGALEVTDDPSVWRLTI